MTGFSTEPMPVDLAADAVARLEEDRRVAEDADARTASRSR